MYFTENKEGVPIGRNSFIQMTKLSNVKGRISYISSHAKQENLYAVYETTERKFWRELAKCNQEEFVKSGTEGKCIEARELIIALPESFTEYQPDRLLQLFTNHFKQNYGAECIAALHHNKRKTNYHIHLIFAERKLLDESIVKTASRNMFYDENGKHVRTKKEILGEDGEIREGCHIVKKGEVYEKKLFTVKDGRFKSNSFLDEVKHSYTDLINIYVQDEKQKLQVFERGGVYLATKKIGKNNPKAHEIESDNQKRQEWNRAVDMALISGVPDRRTIMEKHIMGENGISYTLGEDGLYYPDLYLPEETEYPIGKYGMLRKTYLKEHRKGLYLELVLAGKLNEHLHLIDEECNQMMDRLVEQMKEKQGVTEELKMQDQMAWVGRMNNILIATEEVIILSMVYV